MLTAPAIASAVEHEEWVNAYSDTGSGFYLGPLGTPLPTSFAPVDAPLVYAGLLDDQAGLGLTTTKQVKKFYALQGGRMIASKVSQVEHEVDATLLEDSRFSRELAFLNPIKVEGGVATQDISTNQTATWEGVIVIDALNIKPGGQVVFERTVCDHAQVVYQGKAALLDLQNLRQYPVTIALLGKITVYTNAAGVIEGGSLYPDAAPATAPDAPADGSQTAPVTTTP